jgi:predicted PurR-regulated permease PerM
MGVSYETERATATDAQDTLARWITFAGCVLVVTVLYLAQVVLVPVAVAILLTFILTPPVAWLERRIGRIAAVLAVTFVAFTLLGFAMWSVGREIGSVAQELPAYRANIRQKIADIRGVQSSGPVEKLQHTLNDIKTDIAKGDTSRGTTTRPLIVTTTEGSASSWGLLSWLVPLMTPLASAGFATALVIFMLLERHSLRDRFLSLFGHGNLAVTTRALDEAATRVSRQLLVQTAVNAIYGLGVGIGLFLIGVPYPLLWAVLAAALRFIPYIGTLAGAAAPILVGLAALSGWIRPLSVIGLFVGLELFTNLVLETVLYAGATGMSQVALLVAVAFWSWLWGPAGLLMATPLTVCVVVLGKHVTGLAFLSTIMGDEPALAADHGYYQRLLARDQSDAWDLIESHLGAHDPETVYDALMLPALNYVERDRLEGRLSEARASAVFDATRELLVDVSAWRQAHGDAGVAACNDDGDSESESKTEGETQSDVKSAANGRARPALRVLAHATGSVADELALEMLRQLGEPCGLSVEVTDVKLSRSELIARAQRNAHDAICIADLPPGPSSRTRYAVKKIRAALPEMPIIVGRWAAGDLADEQTQPLMDAGATHVGATLLDTLHALQRTAAPARDLSAA